MKKILIRTSLVLLLVFGMAANASALQTMTGGLSFSGSFALDTGSVVTGNRFLDFTNVVVQEGSGTWLTVPINTLATFTPFSFNPALAVTPLWSFNSLSGPLLGITFHLDASATTMSFTRLTLPNGNPVLIVSGFGTISAPGYADTVATWDITTNSGANTFSFSASSTAVPEPFTLILLGSGLIGLAGLRRKLS